jgi:hypothetical protein
VKYYRTLMLVEVLGNEPFEGDIEDLHSATYDGAFSGSVMFQETTELWPTSMVERLLSTGSDPQFLGLNEDGTECSEEDYND